jgi:DNA-binding transcriptional ArsR family regulator/uncharacterized protein YndB with AHSA1/START domain
MNQDTSDLDPLFRALADPSRRRILDLLKARPGITVGELGAHFVFSRFAVMKHLRLLEEVGLVIRRREGKTKRLYLNAVPIQTIHDRWISRYSALWAAQLTSLKYQLEGEESAMPAATQVQHVHVVHIRTTPERLWEALTNPEQTRQYYYGTEVVSDFRVGSPLEYHRIGPDGTRESVIVGKVLEADAPRRLVHTFAFTMVEDESTRVTYELEPMGHLVKLTLIHEGFDGETETYKMVRTGWTPIVDGLKTYLETGQPMGFPSDH